MTVRLVRRIEPLPVQYVTHGFALVPIPFGQKGPTHPGWNLRENCIRDVDAAARIGEGSNIGLAHAYCYPSPTCSLDIDDLQAATGWTQRFGIDLASYINAENVVIISSGRKGRLKIIYWSDEPLLTIQPPGSGLEFRCAARNGSTVQCVLPPSVHPITGKPYVWIGNFRQMRHLPPELKQLWQSLISRSEVRASRDHVIERLQQRGLIRSSRPGGGVNIDCPFQAEHSMDGGTAETVYWPAHTGGYANGHFHCLHAHCATRSDNEFLTALELHHTISPKGRFQPPVITPRSINASDLISRDFEPVAWLVVNLIPEGLLVLAAGPKNGKSWFVLHLAIACSSGGEFLGRQVRTGAVLYLALEDNERRLQQRLRKLLGDPPYDVDTLSNVEFWTTSNRADNHGLEHILRWLDEHPDARLVIVDTLECFRPSRNSRANSYGEDYEAMQELRRLLEERRLTVIVVHHTRKLEAEDPMDLISGTHGITGAADGLLLIQRKRGDPNGTLLITGRDIADDGEYAVRFDYAACIWRMEGKASEVGKTPPRQRILDVVARADAPMGTQEMADALNIPDNNVRQLVRKLVVEGQLFRTERGRYRVPDTIDNK